MSPNFSVIIPAHHPHIASASFREDLQLRFIEQSRSVPAAARNRICHAFGRFLAFTGDDCVLEPRAGRAAGGYLVKALAANQTAKNFAAPRKAFEESGFDESFRAAEERKVCFRRPHAKRPLLYAPEAVVYQSHGGGGAIRVEPLRFHRNLKTGSLRVSSRSHCHRRSMPPGSVWERTLAK